LLRHDFLTTTAGVAMAKRKSKKAKKAAKKSAKKRAVKKTKARKKKGSFGGFLQMSS